MRLSLYQTDRAQSLCAGSRLHMSPNFSTVAFITIICPLNFFMVTCALNLRSLEKYSKRLRVQTCPCRQRAPESAFCYAGNATNNWLVLHQLPRVWICSSLPIDVNVARCKSLLLCSVLHKNSIKYLLFCFLFIMLSWQDSGCPVWMNGHDGVLYAFCSPLTLVRFYW